MMTSQWVFDLKEDDTYWCTADVGWVTGHSYIVYGPLGQRCDRRHVRRGARTGPTKAASGRSSKSTSVTIFYTAPTAIRAFIKWGDQWPEKHDLSSLRLLGTVGEPINPEAWMWYHRVIGQERCPIVDTWWQTETGAIMISPASGRHADQAGQLHQAAAGHCAGYRGPGRERAVPANQGGFLVMRQPWPSMLRTLYGDTSVISSTYFSEIKGCYFAGDGARHDEDGYYWIMGRVDDVLNVAGHRLSTMEIEERPRLSRESGGSRRRRLSARAQGRGDLLLRDSQAGGRFGGSQRRPQEPRPQANRLGRHARLDPLHRALPKTRSGKIMRRLLRDIAAGRDQVGDTTTLEDFAILAKLRQEEE